MKKPAAHSSVVIPVAGLEPYYFHKLKAPDTVGSFTGIEWEIRRKLNGRKPWGYPRQLVPTSHPSSSRTDLTVKLYDQYEEFHSTYHRLLAFSAICKTYWDDTGALLKKPRTVVPSSQWEVHHRDFNNYNCALTNLVIISKPLHRKCTREHYTLPRPPCGWGK